MRSLNSITLSNFSFPLRTPLRSAWGEVQSREGQYLSCQTPDGQFAIGELSPLPGFNRESLVEATENLQKAIGPLLEIEIPETWDKLSELIENFAKEFNLLPSVLWALEMLLADFSSRATGLGLAQFLNPEASSAVIINGLLSGEKAALLDKYDSKKTQGFSTYKIKLLPDQALEQVAAIKKISSIHPTPLKFRLDCNRGLSLAAAKRLMDHLDGLAIEYIEEPLAETNIESFRELREHCDIPLALDESADDPLRRAELLDKNLCTVMIIKPMLLGGFARAQKITADLSQKGISYVFTSTLETPVGLLAGLQLCAGLQRTKSNPVFAAGFDTLGLFANTFFGNRLAVQDGIIEIPNALGLGLKHSEREEILRLGAVSD